VTLFTFLILSAHLLVKSVLNLGRTLAPEEEDKHAPAKYCASAFTNLGHV